MFPFFHGSKTFDNNGEIDFDRPNDKLTQTFNKKVSFEFGLKSPMFCTDLGAHSAAGCPYKEPPDAEKGFRF